MSQANRRPARIVSERKLIRRSRFRRIQGSPIGAFVLIFFASLFLAVFVLFMQRRWRAPGQRAIVIVHDAVDPVRKPLTIVIIDPQSPRLTIAPLPPERSFSPLLGYGTYQSQALVGLTQLDGLKWDFLTGSLSLELGVALDGIIWSRSEKIESRGDVRAAVLAVLANRSATTLAYWDRGRLLAMLESIPDYKLDISFPAQADEDAVEKWAARTIQDNQIRSSGITVAIQNASGIQGLATRYSRMLRIMGYDVRNIETIPEQTRSRLVHRPEAESTSQGQWAIHRLVVAASYLEKEVDEELAQKLRSDLVLVLGTDMRERLTLRP